MNSVITKYIISALIFILTFSSLSFAQMEESLQAHGGLDTFREYGTLEYDMLWQFGQYGGLKDHQLIDLDSRKILITGDAYKVGFDGNAAWITPGTDALPLPARFYSSTPFYFFCLPFLFADPGVNLESLGSEELGEKGYSVVKVTYDEGVGDTPDDNYVAYIDRNTGRLELVHYIVTYPPLMGGKTVEALERHAAVYEKWQEVGGLLVPQKIVLYDWKGGMPAGEPRGSILFENVTFKKENPDPSQFAKPDGAEVDDSHKQK